MNKEIKIIKFEGSDPTTDVTLKQSSKTIEHIYKEDEAEQSRKWWDSLFENSGSLVSGILTGIAAFGKDGTTMTQAEIDEYNRRSKESTFTFGNIFLYGGAAIIVLVLVYILIKRRS